MGRRSLAVLFLMLLAGGLAGCGLSDPYAARGPRPTTATSVTTTVGNADPAPERGGTIPAPARAQQARVGAGAAQPTPEAALRQYARLYVNWAADNVATVQRELASLSTGQARAQALQAAASYRRDETLLKSGVANSGQLVAISASLTTSDQWVLVSSEQTTGKGDYSGLPATLHVIYAETTRTPKGFVVSQWSPQN